jgi:O-antigen/teichoic acid export membrane protein
LEQNDLHKQIKSASKWSFKTEILAKLIAPITNMILARLLVPEAFGIATTVLMIVSFAEMFSDAGFQKFLIQREFKDKQELYQNASVAFWTSIFITTLAALIICIYSEQISSLLGNPGLGNVVRFGSIQLPLYTFASIQIALYKRSFDFKTLFKARFFYAVIPLFITVPLAYLGLSYWALITGSICGVLSNAVYLTIKSEWKPSLFFKIAVLKSMFSFSMWSLVESISIWFTAWIDVFIIGTYLSAYYLGIYKISVSTVGAIIAIITSATTPVMFSSLSRMQNNQEQFNNFYYFMQKAVAYLVFPAGVGIYIYSDTITNILLGDKWSEASTIIGLWGIMSVVLVVFSHYSSEVYRAKGVPKLSVFSQMLHLVFLVPTCIISAKYGFWPLVYARTFIRIQPIIVNFILLQWLFQISFLKTFKNVYKPILCAIAMGAIGFWLKSANSGMLWDIFSICLCALLYFLLVFIFARNDIMLIYKQFIKK